MAREETKNWTFHHVGVIVEDMDKAVEYYKSLGIVDFPPKSAVKPEKVRNQIVWREITAYGEAVVKDGKPQYEIKPGTKAGGVKFCHMGTVPLELIQPGEAFKEVNGDFLKKNGEGIDHIAYTVPAIHFDEEIAKMKSKGLTIIFSGESSDGVGFYYFDTRAVGGIITELMRVP
jgi:methylmalonyl-CoA/ethylmalonyl-CoA epimerase